MKKTLLCSFSMLVMSPAVPARFEMKKERAARKIEMCNDDMPFCLLADHAHIERPLAENTAVGYVRPKPPRRKKKGKPKKNLYTTHPSKCKFSRDGSQLKIRQ